LATDSPPDSASQTLVAAADDICLNQPPMEIPRQESLLRCDAEIFVVSTLILYLELVLIRWIGTEVRVFAFLGNLVLVVCFFGGGLGCFMAARPVSWNRVGVNILLLAWWSRTRFT
jgi:hypothetical protein